MTAPRWLIVLTWIMVCIIAFATGVALGPKLLHHRPITNPNVTVKAPRDGVVTVVAFSDDVKSYEAPGWMTGKVITYGSEESLAISTSSWIGIVQDGQPYHCILARVEGGRLYLDDYLPLNVVLMRRGESPLEALKSARDADGRESLGL